MAKFNVGDKIKIIQRKKNNTSGTEKGWNEPNGNVGEIGYVKDITSNSYNICRTKDEKGYFGWFDEDDLELVSKEVSTTPYVKGKWYGCKKWTSKNDFIKFDRLEDSSMAFYTECIKDKVYQKTNNWWSLFGHKLFEADMSIVSQFLPEGHPDKITAEEFVLPSKWCVKVDKNSQPEEVYKWRDIRWSDAGYICYDKHWNHRVYSTHTEITLEQFKQHVLKESPVVENPKEENYVGRTIKALVNNPEGTDVKKAEIIKIKEINDDNRLYTLEKTKAGTEGMVITKPLNLSNWELVSEDDVDMKAIQEEAKRRFPIGCKFIPADSDKTHTLIEDEYTYEIHGKYIWAHNGYGHLYENGKWATLVSFPSDISEPEKTCFQKGDYIVTLINHGNCGKVNYCSKQKEDSFYLKPEIDTKGSVHNGNTVFDITDKSFTKWRYATPEEAAEYERIGEPYDVTTLQKKEESIPEYVECISPLLNATVGKIYKVIDHNVCESDLKEDYYHWKTSQFKPSTKKAYEAQFKEKKLTKEELVEGEIYIYDSSHISTYPKGPSLAIKEKFYEPNPNWLWTLSITHATEEQKALLRSEIEKRSEKMEKEEWEPGTYAVGVKGNFGVYEGSKNPIPVGHIYTIKENRENSLVVKDHGFWIYKKNLRWFATHEEAFNFSNQLKASPVPKESDYPVMPVDAYPSIKKETFIEDVQSVNVMLRTKRKSIKF